MTVETALRNVMNRTYNMKWTMDNHAICILDQSTALCSSWSELRKCKGHGNSYIQNQGFGSFFKKLLKEGRKPQKIQLATKYLGALDREMS